MKRKNLMLGILAITAVFFSACNQSGTNQSEEISQTGNEIRVDDFKMDLKKSQVMWKGVMLGIKYHEGTLEISNGSLEFEDGKIKGGEFIVNMASIVPTDENYNPEEGSTREKLVGHLSSADFFDVENFPTAAFKITSVEGNTASGEMTIRGTTHPEKVENISILKEGENIIISGEMVFDRKQYDVAWDSPMKEVILSDDVELKFKLIGS